MPEPIRHDAGGTMRYPVRGSIHRLFYRLPLLLWRMGIGPLLLRGMLVLTTWGRVSRIKRHTMLTCEQHGGKAYVLSGWGARSDWYRNLLADPQVTVQFRRTVYTATARRVTDVEEYAAVMGHILRTGGDSHFKPWLQSLDIQETLEDLIAKRERVHLLALDPSDQPGPPPLARDLVWILLIVIAGFLAAALLCKDL